jgi:hypothetical protein
MSEPIDIAVDLGVIPAPIPEAVSLRQMVEAGAPPPRQRIDGILHQGYAAEFPSLRQRRKPRFGLA